LWEIDVARILPILAETELAALKSQAEARCYRVFRDKLPPDWLVLFSVPWVGVTVSGRRYDGEADFIVFAPGLGLLVVEVKGGGIQYVPTEGHWYSVDGRGERHSIKDPFRQAVAEKYAVINILRDDAAWKAAHPGRLLAGHAVLLPDVDRLEGAVSPESPREILGGRPNVDDAQRWVETVLRFWAGQIRDWEPLSRPSLAAAEKSLCGRLEARPLLSVQLEAEERIRIQLTEQQSRVMRAIGSRRRALVCGGAGTGKTLLALERARSLASAGKKTLLVCYNRLLADFFKVCCKDDTNLLCMTFHQLCDWRAQEARDHSKRDVLAEAKATCPAKRAQDLFDVQMPYALALSTEILPGRFDAILVDEGQDFREEYWLGIELMLKGEGDNYLYIFYDQNQSLYTKASSLPVKEEPFVLTFNCRNTASIHRLAYGYFAGDATDPPPGNPGVPVDAITGASVAAQCDAVHAAVLKLVTQERLQPMQVAILVCGQPKESYFEQLRRKPLPRGIEWSIEAPAVAQGVRVDTVRRFKGLEADVVFLWGIDTSAPADLREVMYVGTTRAKSRLTLVGQKEACTRMLT
jgi:hypothetical protein